jgi:putative ABC transport system permease protein
VSFTQSLPIRLLPQIEAVPGVARVNWNQWFGGVVGENTPIVAFATDPERLRTPTPSGRCRTSSGRRSRPRARA